MDWPPARDGQRVRFARFTRWAVLAGLAIAASAAAAVLVLPLAVRGFVRAIEAAVDGCVWVAMSISAGVSLWSVLRRMLGGAAALMVSPQATLALAALVVVGAAAAYGLQRILGAEEESS